MCVCVQVFSGSLQCAAGLMSVSLRALSLAVEEREREKAGGEEGEKKDVKSTEENLQVALVKFHHVPSMTIV